MREIMRRTLLLAAVWAAALSARAQVAVAEPEYVGNVVALTSDTTCVLLPIEDTKETARQSAASYIPVYGLFAKSKVSAVFAGPASAVTLHTGTLRLIYRAKRQDINPLKYLGVSKLDVKRKSRQKTLASGNIFGVEADYAGKERYRVEKYGEHSFLVTLENVAPGQYCISSDNENCMSYSTFGVK